MTSRPSSAASAVRKALKQEKLQFEKTQRAKFFANKQRAVEPSEAYQLPRTLPTRTFFTPHLSPRAGIASANDHLAREYAVILEIHGQPTISITPYNPAREVCTSDHMRFKAPPSIELQNKIHQLEKAGYRFYGTNQDILVFERLYNPKQHAMKWVVRSATVVTASVAAVTAALFAGEYLTSSS